MPHSLQSTLSRQIEVALFSVSAMRRTSRSGTRVNSCTESTAPNALIETSGSSTSCAAARANAMDEGRATSMRSSTSISLSCEG